MDSFPLFFPIQMPFLKEKITKKFFSKKKINKKFGGNFFQEPPPRNKVFMYFHRAQNLNDEKISHQF